MKQKNLLSHIIYGVVHNGLVHQQILKNILYVTAHDIPTKFKVFSSFDINKNLELKNNLLDIGKNNKLDDLEGYPGITPPWGSLTALNLNSGKILWQVPLGYFDELKKRGMKDTGTANFGGATATAGNLVFVGGTLDKLIRAFDTQMEKNFGHMNYLIWVSTSNSVCC